MVETNDKPHEPTPGKIRKARAQGDTIRSNELSSAITYVGYGLAIYVVNEYVGERILQYFFETFQFLNKENLIRLGQEGIQTVLLSLISLTALPSILFILHLISTKGITIRGDRAAVKLDRISPLKNARKKYGVEGLADFLKTVAKIFIVIGSAFIILLFFQDNIYNLMSLTTIAGSIAAFNLYLYSFLTVSCILLAFGAADYLWQTWLFLRRNRMSHHELRDELKESEGDPTLKYNRKQRAQEYANNSLRTAVAQSTVIVVNPTHYAIALQWTLDSITPPLCLAKGVDNVALQIRKLAAENNIPLYSDPHTARALFCLIDVGDVVPREYFKATAAAIRFARTIERRKSQYGPPNT
jgi:flagellar biosynthetic protein FlhB